MPQAFQVWLPHAPGNGVMWDSYTCFWEMLCRPRLGGLQYEPALLACFTLIRALS